MIIHRILLVCIVTLAALVPISVPAQTIIQNNTTLVNLFGGDRYYRIDVPAGKSLLSIDTANGENECSLYVARSYLPSTASYDYSSLNAGANQSVHITNPAAGSWYIYLTGAYLSLTLTVSYSGTTITNGPIGSDIWDYNLNSFVYSAAAASTDGTIYLATAHDVSRSTLFAFNPNGTVKWTGYFSAYDVFAPPAIASDGTIYVVAANQVSSPNGLFVAVTPAGGQKWVFAPAVHPLRPVAVGVDGTIYVPSATNSLYAINPDASVKWTFASASGSLASSPAVIAADGTIYCGFYNSSTLTGKLYAVNPNGTEKWEYTTTQGPNTPAIDATGAVIFGVPNPANKVFAVNANGTLKWQFSASGSAAFTTCYVYSPPVVGTDGVIYISSNSRLYAINSNGTQKWFYDDGVLLTELSYANGPAIDATGRIYFGSRGIFGAGTLYSINANGTLAWLFDAGNEIAGQPIITPDGRIVFGTSDTGVEKIFVLQGGTGPAPSVWPLARQGLLNTASLQVPVIHPSLRASAIGGKIVVQWPTNTTGFTLVSTTSLLSTNWTTVTPAPVVTGTNYVVTNAITAGPHLYRLKK